MIVILMATYNGEKYVEQQLDSLLNQTCQDFVVHIQDDNSQDRTPAILKKYALRHPDKFFVETRVEAPHNAKHNFFSLMRRYKDEYVMLCDQDDVWLPDKISSSLKKLWELERTYGKATPLLVHTDLTVVDESLSVIHPSFQAMMNADYSRTLLRELLIQNTLTGCTAIYNQALSDLIQEEPSYMVMHDWYLMLVASAFGKIDHLKEPTVLYRQHTNNEIGAHNVKSLRYILHKLIHYPTIKEALNNTYRQAEGFLHAYAAMLDTEQLELLHQYCTIPQKSKIGRWRAICKLGVLKHGVARKIANLIFI